MAELGQFQGLPVVCGPGWPGVTYFTTTRLGGISEGDYAALNLGEHTDDELAHVQQNREHLKRLLPAPPLWLRQVHGTHVYDRDSPTSAKDRASPQADAQVTAAAGRVLSILTADCLPVVLGSADGRLIGVAHAGWRGLLAGVLENTLEALVLKNRGDRAIRWRAWIGPGISQRHFEVGDEVRQAFVATDPSLATFFQTGIAPGKWQANLAAIARHRLQRWGVAQVDSCDLCTYARADLFYSYRRTPGTGRFATLAWRSEGVPESAGTDLPRLTDFKM